MNFQKWELFLVHPVLPSIHGQNCVKLNVAIDLTSSGDFLAQNDWPLSLIQISCPKTNLESSFFNIFENIDWKIRE